MPDVFVYKKNGMQNAFRICLLVGVARFELATP